MVGSCSNFSNNSSLRKTLMNKFILVIIAVTCVLSGNVEAKKKLYKWVDENGIVSYSDKVPPVQIKKQHEEINGQGVILEKVGNARTKEEFQAEKKAKLIKIAEEKEVEKQNKIRENIIKAYTNESEIIRLKEERLLALKRNIEQAEESLVFQNESREQLLSRAADSERNGNKISKVLKSRIKIVEDKIMYQEEYIIVKKEEIGTVNKKFTKDLAIYRSAAQYK